MPNYRRLFVPGGTYAFTVCLDDRSSRLLLDEIGLLHQCIEKVHAKFPFETIAWVFLPDHFHTIWRLPENDHDFAKRLRLIKTHFTKSLEHTPAGRRHGERGIWQRRYWEHLIRDDADLGAHMDYIHWNPVKHGYVADPSDWPHSSWHRYKDGWGRAA
ncbi:transposase [Ponticaulis sp.]|uniref:REP-associated tyrosine transposase n=1 Tax=Ponticaulis sp. TaxID=2020902 RepID=UPI000B6C5F0E|nr:transposase [Ponticaulis sp.]MAJ08971.1 transposase [Ponticaulis sp.]RPG16766.1 MAG: transposase [Hyphomonadaceae bacterium TMED125]HBH88914.1 transposase [Hyphomonadaceae bacterium]